MNAPAPLEDDVVDDDSAERLLREAEQTALGGSLIAAARQADHVVEAAADPGLRARAARVLAAISANRGLLRRAAQLHTWAETLDAVSPAAGMVARIGSGIADDREVPDPTIPTVRAAAEATTAQALVLSLRGQSCRALGELTRAAGLLEGASRPVLLDACPAALGAVVALHRGEPEMAAPLLDRAIAADLGGAPNRRRHRLLRAWTRMTIGDDHGARADLADAAAVPGPVAAHDDLLAVGVEASLARRGGDTAHLVELWARGRASILAHPVDVFSLLPLGELLIVASRLGESAWLQPHLEAADEVLDHLGRPPLWAAPWYFAGVLAAAAAQDVERASERSQRLGALEADTARTPLLAAAASSWVEILSGRVDPGAVMVAAAGLAQSGLAWEGARLLKEAALRTTDRRAISTLLNGARGLQARITAHSAPALSNGAAPESSLPGPQVVVGREMDPAGDTSVSAVGPVAPAAAVGISTEAAASPDVGLLSERERQVAVLLLDGLTYRQIGEQLYITSKTVEHHVGRMRHRLGCQDRSALFRDLRAALHPA